MTLHISVQQWMRLWGKKTPAETNRKVKLPLVLCHCAECQKMGDKSVANIVIVTALTYKYIYILGRKIEHVKINSTPIPYWSACARMQYSAQIIWMVLDVACCGALLYPRARSRNVETCGPRDSVRWQKTVGMLLLVPLSIYTYTSLQFQNPLLFL